VAERSKIDGGGADAGQRPLVHFTPPTGWLNDPNGLVHLDGEYHLCYQHHPHSTDWGPMHWGHAVSTDLLTWTDLPIALEPDGNGTVYSGSAVVDHEGTAGRGVGALVACYTQFTRVAQVQSVATSSDRGRTWQPLPTNPVLRPPPGTSDFRDPKVLRYRESGRAHWVMALAVGDGVWLYTSDDLRRWEPASRFHPESGPPSGVWECPDLFPLVVEGTECRRWVLVCGVSEHAPAGGSGTRYWIGEFDGTTFTADGPARWIDHGADFYAAQSWSDVPDGRRIWLAWMSNWAYAARVPAGVRRGRMTLPRTLRLVDDGAGPVLAQRPVGELMGRLGTPVAVGAAPTPLPGGAGLVRAAVDPGGSIGLAVAGARGRACVRYDGDIRRLTLLRESAAGDAVGPGYAGPHHAPVPSPRTGGLGLDVVVDRGSVEVFVAGGRVCMTDLVVGLENDPMPQVSVTGDGIEEVRLRAFSVGGCEGGAGGAG
jgi:sucrose-6-phosphate hydrolase SacC (GH32 family)